MIVLHLKELDHDSICGNGPFRPLVVSALSRFGPGSFRPI